MHKYPAGLQVVTVQHCPLAFQCTAAPFTWGFSSQPRLIFSSFSITATPRQHNRRLQQLQPWQSDDQRTATGRCSKTYGMSHEPASGMEMLKVADCSNSDSSCDRGPCDLIKSVV